MKSVNNILFSEDPDELRDALRKAKDLAKAGNIIALLDFLCPEDKTKKYVREVSPRFKKDAPGARWVNKR